MIEMTLYTVQKKNWTKRNSKKNPFYRNLEKKSDKLSVCKSFVWSSKQHKKYAIRNMQKSDALFSCFFFSTPSLVNLCNNLLFLIFVPKIGFTKFHFFFFAFKKALGSKMASTQKKCKLNCFHGQHCKSSSYLSNFESHF